VQHSCGASWLLLGGFLVIFDLVFGYFGCLIDCWIQVIDCWMYVISFSSFLAFDVHYLSACVQGQGRTSIALF
jgi:hypothetical protein